MRAIFSCALLFTALSAGAVEPQRADIPFDGSTVLKAWIFQPAKAPGLRPVAIINHGSPPGGAPDRAKMNPKFTFAAEQFVQWGFIVVVPTRRGYGETGGAWAETTHTCDNASFYEGGLESAKDIGAAVKFAKSLPDADPAKILLVGQSAGGWGVLAAAMQKDIDAVAIVNFAGGRGGMRNGVPNFNCSPDKLVKAVGDYGAESKRPSLWIYTENDHYFAPELSKRMVENYKSKGGKAQFTLLPAFGRDGHSLFGARDGVVQWRGPVESFLIEQRFLPMGKDK
ncbi:MAG: prolyl oligopeptidase family serine peptidase [Betaproteobacteria bacterium]